MKNEELSSTRPYLIRALHEWCTDNGFTPHVAVKVDDSVQVPREHVNDGEIVLNVGLDATSGLQLGNDFIEFKARFGGQPRDIIVPIGRVIAIYARENGQGMAFPPPVDVLSRIHRHGSAVMTQDMPADTCRPLVQLVAESSGVEDKDVSDAPVPPRDPGPSSRRASLKRVK